MNHFLKSVVLLFLLLLLTACSAELVLATAPDGHTPTYWRAMMSDYLIWLNAAWLQGAE